MLPKEDLHLLEWKTKRCFLRNSQLKRISLFRAPKTALTPECIVYCSEVWREASISTGRVNVGRILASLDYYRREWLQVPAHNVKIEAKKIHSNAIAIDRTKNKNLMLDLN